MWASASLETQGEGEKPISVCQSAIASREEGILIFCVSERLLRVVQGKYESGCHCDTVFLPTQSDIHGTLHSSPPELEDKPPAVEIAGN